MQRFVHRAGVGVTAWRQGATASAAGTCALRDAHRRIVSRGRVVRGAVGFAATGVTSVSSDLAASYAVVTSISADNTANYAIRAAVSADAGASYFIRAAVAADLAASYAILAPGAVVSDFGASYAIRAAVVSDRQASYVIGVNPSTDRTYPLAGMTQFYPLAGVAQT